MKKNIAQWWAGVARLEQEGGWWHKPNAKQDAHESFLIVIQKRN